MRAIVCPDYGPPEILTVEEQPDPTPGPGQVVVQHKAWGINYVDVLMCAGGYQHKPEVPFVPGLEACGALFGSLAQAARFRLSNVCKIPIVKCNVSLPRNASP